MTSIVLFDNRLAEAAGLKFPPSAEFLVVSDFGVGSGTLGSAPSKEQQKAEQELIDDIKAGKHPSESNLVVVAARASKAVQPALLADRSLIYKREKIQVYLRETSVGLVAFGLAPELPAMFVGIYPLP